MSLPNGYTITSGIPVHEDMALKLMVHHLQLAHVYFQNIPDTPVANREEASRLFLAGQHLRLTRWVDDGGLGYAETVPAWITPPELVAGIAWLDKVQNIYEEMKKEY